MSDYVTTGLCKHTLLRLPDYPQSTSNKFDSTAVCLKNINWPTIKSRILYSTKSQTMCSNACTIPTCIQNIAGRLVLNLTSLTVQRRLMSENHILADHQVKNSVQYKIAVYVFKCLHNSAPLYTFSQLLGIHTSHIFLRSTDTTGTLLSIPIAKRIGASVPGDKCVSHQVTMLRKSLGETMVKYLEGIVFLHPVTHLYMAGSTSYMLREQG